MSNLEITLSTEQKDVVAARQNRLMVSAAAGAGKTSTLVERYIRHIIDDGLSPEEILTITFTRKAAAEMKERIIARLRREGREADARVAETGPIQTIHGFCERFLRSNALEAGLDPDFDILSESELSRWIDEAIRQVFSDTDEEDQETEELIRLLSGRRSYRARGSPYEMIKGPIREVLQKFRSSNWTMASLRDLYARKESVVQSWNGEILKHLSAEVAEALAGIPPDRPFPDRIKSAYQAVGEAVPIPFASVSDPSHTDESAQLSAGLVQLVCRVWGRLDARMAREQKLDFAALEGNAVRTLHQSSIARERVSEQFRVVMVDEAQDVNPIQHSLLNSLGIETELMVGDTQQSIYGFRQADIDQFHQKVRDGSHLRLSKNYRSEEGILKLIDKVFGAWWGDAYVPMLAPKTLDPNVIEIPSFPGVEIWEHRAKDSDLTASYIEEMINEGEKPGEIVVLVRTSSQGNEIETALLHRNIEAKVLGESERFYSRMEIRDLANSLAALGNRYDDYSLLAMLRSPIAGLSFRSIVELSLASPVAEALESITLSDQTDAERVTRFLSWFMPLAKRADRLPAWEIIAEIFARSPYLEALDGFTNARQATANVRKLLTLAVQSPELGPIEFADQIREIRDLRHKEGDAATMEETDTVVRIMNIHKAKGLEFPVVVLPQMFDPLIKSTREVEADPRLPMVAACFRKGARVPAHQWLSEIRKAREVEEELRVLYVAMTRAKRRLCLAMAPNLTKDCLARRLSTVLGWRAKEPIGFDQIRRIRSAEDL